ncbi:hypothetical protein BU15DRAFT_66742 [Melanogaster broomeanus]|nr:hypothetical protein BU15DRAFT_66742 [Melanogaster broomeanus]
MYIKAPVYYGYFMNIEHIVQYALIHNERLRNKALQQGLLADGLVADMLYSTFHRVKENSGIDLAYGSVWIGRHRDTFCWCLPPNMWKKDRKPENTDLLERFKALIGAVGEPLLLPSDDFPEPRSFRNSDPPEWIERYTRRSFASRVRSGELTIEKLMKSADMPDISGLSLADSSE